MTLNASQRALHRLQQRQSHLTRLYDELGPTLSDWIIPNRLRDQLDPTRTLRAPRLPSERGATLVLFKTDASLLEDGSCLPRGFALPFIWIEGRADHPSLPGGMREIAGSVREVLSAALGDDLSAWGLQPGTHPSDAAAPEWAKLAGLPLSCGSAWAPLAAALWIASKGGTPKPNVFSTGAWSPETKTLVSVSGVDAKREAIGALVGDRPATFFVPAANWDAIAQSSDAEPSSIDSRAYPAAERALSKAMQAHLTALELPPDDTQPLDARLTYGNRPWLDRRTRSDYYRRHLVNPLAHSLRERHELPTVRRVVVNLGFAFEQALLALGALVPASCADPVHVCVVHTPKSASKLDALRERARHLPVVFAPADVGLLGQGDGADLVERVSAWLAQEPEATARLVDVTGGNSLMSIFAYTIAQRAKAHAIYIDHRPDDRRGVHYGNEQIVFLHRSTP